MKLGSNARWTVIIISANLLINAAGVYAINQLRVTAMAKATAERANLDRKMDAAWVQREQLAMHLEKTCRR